MLSACRKSAVLRLVTIAVAAIGVSAVVSFFAKPAESVEAKSSPTGADVFGQKIVPFVAKYCSDCHSGAKPEGNLELTKFKDAAEVAANRKTWRKVLGKLAAREMPPVDQDQPTAAEIEQVTNWIDAELARPVPFEAQDPGRLTIHRLNRAEYNNTIRDLVGVDYHPADDFPADDVGYGFDNIGDVLSLSPLLLEKYVAAAERIMDQAIAVPRPDAPPPTRTFEVAKLDATVKAELNFRGARRMMKNGELWQQWKTPYEGDYRIRVKARGDKVGDDLPHMVIKVDDREVKGFDVKVERMPPSSYECTTHLEPGDHKLAIAFTNEFTDPKSKDDFRRDRALLVSKFEVDGPLGPLPFEALPESHRKIFGAPLKSGASVDEEAEAARKIVRRFADRAFRRPAKDDEIDRLMQLWAMADKDGEPFERSIQLALEAVLVSPHFLFRVETDPRPDDPQSKHEINDYELATRLSYFLWSSMPDAELLSLCQKGSLRKDGHLEAQVRRMLKDPKAQALVDNFVGQWLQTRRLPTITPDSSVFSQFDESLREAMQKETELFFLHVMSEDRSVLEFLDADYTWANERLAKLYGISGVSGDEFRRVSLAGTHRGGLLTEASVLLITSNPGRTSPVKRGKWVLETLLGAPPPNPPPNVPALPDDKKAPLTGTLRQRMEQHRADPICASCHKTMDPLGFSLENFDAIGRWRTKDGGQPIDASGVLPGGKTFDGVEGLRQILKAKKDQFVRCLAEKMLTYALGRGLEDFDDAAVDQIAHAAAKNDYRFSAFAIEIARSAPFQMRRGASGK
jgi:mono/diheme cytochrome c family protein